MIELIEAAVVLVLVCALAAVLLGEVLTRSIVAASAAIAGFGLVRLAAGGGVVALCIAIVGLLSLSIVQLFGWMLVDIDHDHLPRVALRTAFARGLALALLRRDSGCSAVALRRGELASVPGSRVAALDPDAVGAFFLGASGALPAILGCLIAAALLTASACCATKGRMPDDERVAGHRLGRLRSALRPLLGRPAGHRLASELRRHARRTRARTAVAGLALAVGLLQADAASAAPAGWARVVCGDRVGVSRSEWAWHWSMPGRSRGSIDAEEARLLEG